MAAAEGNSDDGVAEDGQPDARYKLPKGLGRFEEGRGMFECCLSGKTAGRQQRRGQRPDATGQGMGQSLYKMYIEGLTG